MKTSKPLYGAVLALALATPLAPTNAAAETNLNFSAGQKQLDEDDWSPVDEQSAFGVSIHHEPEGWWLGATVQVYNGAEDSFATLSNGNPAELRNDIWELSIGPSKVFKIPGVPVRVFAAGGYTYMTASLKIREDTGSGIVSSRYKGDGNGLWASTGAFVTLAEKINLGLEGRYSTGEATLGGSDFELGGTYVGALIGLNF